ncbi:MAG: response regulator transcription factor [Caulobacteraceae bacterium]|nr:response regulator transcription factor [Caulobacteraceae bacterium]
MLCALCKGEPNKQIAATLELAEATVKSHLASIYKVLGVLNRSQAILSAKPYLDSFEAEGSAKPSEPDAK